MRPLRYETKRGDGANVRARRLDPDDAIDAQLAAFFHAPDGLRDLGLHVPVVGGGVAQDTRRDVA